MRSGLIMVLRTMRLNRGSNGSLHFGHRPVLEHKRTVIVREVHGFLCSRTGLYPKSRKPFESRFNRTVLRTVIRPLLTVPFESEPSKKKKKKTQKNKRKRNTTPSPEKHRNTTPSPQKHRNKTPSQKKKKKSIMSAIAISRETQHVFMFLLLLSSGHITQLPFFRNSSLRRSKL